MGRHISWLLAVVVACLLAGCGPFAGNGQDPASGDGQDPAGGAGVFVVDADGSALTRLTNDLCMGPAWSPDGRRIAFAAHDRKGEAIHVMDADGANRAEVATTPEGSRDPAWSPDGERIAFVTPFGAVFVVGADGSGLTEVARVTPNTGGGEDAVVDGVVFEWSPSWSPDGQRLAIPSGNAAAPQIFVVNANGAGLTQLTDLPGQAVAPAWSPDGSLIAFVALEGMPGGPPSGPPSAPPDRPPGAPPERPLERPLIEPSSGGSVYTIKPDGTGLTRLSEIVPDFQVVPTWSPDGSRLLFAAMPGAPDDGLYAVNPDGSGLTILTGIGGHGAADPTWSPDGTKIAYSSYFDSVLTVIAADGTVLARLNEIQTGVYAPEWSPDGTRLVFFSMAPYSE